VRACYALFVVAVFLAVVKLGVSSAEPRVLRMVPGEPASRVVELAEGESPGAASLDLTGSALETPSFTTARKTATTNKA
jgi:hypothetical protein